MKETHAEASIDDTAGLQKWIQQSLNKRPDIVLDGGLLLTPLSGDAGPGQAKVGTSPLHRHQSSRSCCKYSHGLIDNLVNP